MSNSHNNHQLTNQEPSSKAFPPRQRKFDYKIKLSGNIPLYGNTLHVNLQKYIKHTALVITGCSRLELTVTFRMENHSSPKSMFFSS